MDLKQEDLDPGPGRNVQPQLEAQVFGFARTTSVGTTVWDPPPAWLGGFTMHRNHAFGSCGRPIAITQPAIERVVEVLLQVEGFESEVRVIDS